MICKRLVNDVKINKLVEFVFVRHIPVKSSILLEEQV